MPKGFIVLFSGNIGEAQGFECIVKAALNTQHVNEIKWVILGNGRKSEWLRSKIVELNLQDTLYMLGRYPVEMMPYFYYHADALLISLKDNPIFSVTIPAKLQTYMAFGKPIIGSINGICAEIIEEAMCGYVSKAGDYISLANNIIKIYHMNPEDLKKLGENGKRYYNINFNKQKTVELINYTINSL
ncbi:MAG TPA: glycosyltransferase family 4 protein [Bacteroidales bacterium]|nr:glycosyltransferase family 4 protein [Bacteroidales bacterium]